MKTKSVTMAACSIVALSMVSARATLQVTDGNFSANPVQTNNVTGWFDTVNATPAYWWETTWAGPNVSPNGTPVLGLSYMFTTLNWAYQSIGVNDGALSSLGITYDVGSFTDAGGLRDLGVTFSVYRVDGTYAGGADNVDINGATGATLLDTVTIFSGPLNPGQMLTGQTVTLDISGSTGSQLFLRLQNAVGTVGEPWVAVDNLAVAPVPEPAAFALMGLGGLALLLRRRSA